eukprot:53591-Eustigmatos_ZCMA.PRE.1
MTVDAQLRVREHRYMEWKTTEGGNKVDIPRVFTDAVRKRMDHGDQPVAFLCSGGLDSSIIVELAKSLAPERDLHAFSVRFEEGESLDTRYATELLRAMGVKHTVVAFTWSDVEEHLEEVVRM